jgi:hypothetical protein
MAKSVEDMVNLFNVIVGPQLADSLQLHANRALDWSDCNVATLCPEKWVRFFKGRVDSPPIVKQQLVSVILREAHQTTLTDPVSAIFLCRSMRSTMPTPASGAWPKSTTTTSTWRHPRRTGTATEA